MLFFILYFYEKRKENIILSKPQNNFILLWTQKKVFTFKIVLGHFSPCGFSLLWQSISPGYFREGPGTGRRGFLTKLCLAINRFNHSNLKIKILEGNLKCFLLNISEKITFIFG
jgi:hypothetical protein